MGDAEVKRPKVNQDLVQSALMSLGTATRERIAVRLRFQGVPIESWQVGNALALLKRRSLVRRTADAAKGPKVRWELVPRPGGTALQT